MSSIQIEQISESVFSDMRNDWNALLERSAANEVFLLWEWVYAWWKAFDHESDDLFILVGKTSENKIIGIAPFYLEKKKEVGGNIRAIVRFCSSLETAPDHLDLITDKDHDQLFSEAILHYLKEHGDEWDMIQLDGLRENGLISRYMVPHARIHDFLVDSFLHYDCPYLPIDQSFANYLKSFPSKKRQNLMRERRLLLERDKVDCRVAQRKEDAEKLFKELISLHTERADRKGIRTSFYGDRKYLFHSLLISLLIEFDKICLALLYKEEMPLVAFYGMKHNSKYYYYQSGISSEGEKKRAGAVLISLIIERAFAEGCHEFDFLRGNEEYKHYWTKKVRQTHSITIRKNDFQGMLARNISLIKRRTKSAVRSLLSSARTFRMKHLNKLYRKML